MTEEQRCPICDKNVTPIERYPNYVCVDCQERMTDKEGRRVDFAERSEQRDGVIYLKGIGGYYVDTDENYDSLFCFIDGSKFRASEARFGGVVIQPVEDQ
ncbi:hypothetical protein AB2B38_008330 [Balneola sp. MJW-20]|uniref:hypothetical protein n=1 Tax=Gracilimonas aurantiaca TaxID=3234185 RepID=UPI003466E804